jgi:hypothetical protein
MKPFDEQQLPGDLERVVERLRGERPEADGLTLDRIKTRAMANASVSRRKGFSMRSRTITTALTVAMLAAGTGGVIAGGGNGNGNGNASDSQYKPGKGCGDKNHTHARHDECKNNGSHGNGSHQSHHNGGSHGD